MAILAVIVTLSIAATRKALIAAKVSGCMSRLHQIGVAISVYTAENNGRYPVVWNSDKNLIWADYLLDLIAQDTLSNKRAIFIDPTNTIPCPIYDNATKATYSANDVIFGYDPGDSGNKAKQPGIPQAALSNPSQLILVGTGCQNPNNHGGANASFWNPWQMSWPAANKSQVVPYSAATDVDTGSAPGYLRYRVNGGIGALMGDGSVRIVKKDELTVGNLNPY